MTYKMEFYSDKQYSKFPTTAPRLFQNKNTLDQVYCALLSLKVYIDNLYQVSFYEIVS